MRTSAVLGMMRQLIAAGVDLLLPEFCLLCAAEDLPAHPRRLCAPCAASLRLEEPARSCPICAFPDRRALGGRRPCLACRRRRPPWRSLTVIGPYEGGLGRLLRRLKYEPLRAAALPLADLMAALAGTLAISGDLRDIDLILPVPLTRAGLGRRGFNQATEIARSLPAVLGAPLRPHWAARRGGPGQVGRSRQARRRLGASVFQIDPRVLGCRVLLVDDVVTTGTTMRAFAQAVRAAGARDVLALAAARTPALRSGASADSQSRGR